MTAFIIRCFVLFIGIYTCLPAAAQKDLPQDYLPASFHKGRREAARALMPDSSVLVVFAAPTRNYANDVDYLYHQNPDLYYFTGYNEPHAVFLLFKEEQQGTDGSKYKELFFVQERNARSEQWNGRRLGKEGVAKNLGITHVFNGKDFANAPVDFTRFKEIQFRLPEGVTDDVNEQADLFDLVAQFRKKINLPSDFNQRLYDDLYAFSRNATTSNLPRLVSFFKEETENKEAYRNNKLVQSILTIKDSTDLELVRSQVKQDKFSSGNFFVITGKLREIKTDEELLLIRKAVEISCQGQNEVMKTVRADMSEMEIRGLHEYVHKKHGAESVGYGSIIGSGENGCILHYMENTKTSVGNEMLLMDVGAEYHGYTADVTRTIPADGKFSAEERTIYQLVYNAQEAAFKILKDGAKWSDASAAAKEVIAEGLTKLGIIQKKEEVDKYYPHGLGHHIGLDVHDRSFSPILKKGMVLSVEPGIYIPANSNCDKKWWSIAVRIEDNALIRENDYELLSSFAPRSIDAIEKMIAEKSLLDNYKLPPLQSGRKKAF